MQLSSPIFWFSIIIFLILEIISCLKASVFSKTIKWVGVAVEHLTLGAKVRKPPQVSPNPTPTKSLGREMSLLSTLY